MPPEALPAELAMWNQVLEIIQLSDDPGALGPEPEDRLQPPAGVPTAPVPPLPEASPTDIVLYTAIRPPIPLHLLPSFELVDLMPRARLPPPHPAASAPRQDDEDLAAAGTVQPHPAGCQRISRDAKKIALAKNKMTGKATAKLKAEAKGELKEQGKAKSKAKADAKAKAKAEAKAKAKGEAGAKRQSNGQAKARVEPEAEAGVDGAGALKATKKCVHSRAYHQMFKQQMRNPGADEKSAKLAARQAAKEAVDAAGL